MLSPKLQVLQRTVRRLIRRGARGPLEKVVKKTHSADLGYLFADLADAERREILACCASDKKRAEIIASADVDLAAKILIEMGAVRAAEILHHLEPDDISDILEHVPAELMTELLQRMHKSDRHEVEDLSRYESATAGGIMSPRYLALNRDTTAKEAIEQLQKRTDELEMVFYIYVVNEVNQLLGVVSLRQLVTTSPETKLLDLMASECVRVHPEEDQEEVAKLTSRYGFLAIPVVDDSNKLLGIVTVDDVIDVLREEAAEDVLRMGGAGPELVDQQNIFRSFMTRLPWLTATAIGGVISATVILIYSEHIHRYLPTVFFVPVLLSLVGVAASQSAAILSQSIAMGRAGSQMLMQVGKQTLIGFFLGSIYGLGLMAIAYIGLIKGFVTVDAPPLMLSATLGAAVTVSIASASTIGGLFPMMLARIRLDPALATGPIVAIIADVISIAIYFGVTHAVLG